MKFINWWTVSFVSLVLTILAIFVIGQLYISTPTQLETNKVDIRNHLVWSVKGECFFVKGDQEGLVNMIRVVDCDRQ